MAKVFKTRCPKPAGKEPSTLCSLHGRIGKVYQIVGAGVSRSLKSGAKPEELVVERSLS